MTPKETVLINYGLMLRDVMMGFQDHLPIISRTIQQNNLNQDEDLIKIGNSFQAVMLALKNLDDTVNTISELVIK